MNWRSGKHQLSASKLSTQSGTFQDLAKFPKTKLGAKFYGHLLHNGFMKLDRHQVQRKKKQQSSVPNTTYVTQAMQIQKRVRHGKNIPQILIDAGNNLKLTRTSQRISLSVFPGLLCVPSIARDKTHGDRTCRNALQKKRVK